MRVVVPILIALTLLIIPVYAQQYWYLSNLLNTTLNVYYMNSTPAVASGGKSIRILPTQSAIWIANQSAQVNVTFPATNWVVYLLGSGKSVSITVSIGVWDGSAFTSYGSTTLTNIKLPTDIVVPVESFTVPKGCRLALKIDNIGLTTTVNIKVARGSSYSHLEYPFDVPPYPIPEVLTLALVLTGIIVLIRFQR